MSELHVKAGKKTSKYIGRAVGPGGTKWNQVEPGHILAFPALRAPPSNHSPFLADTKAKQNVCQNASTAPWYLIPSWFLAWDAM